jgi:hypothetical protein
MPRFICTFFDGERNHVCRIWGEEVMASAGKQGGYLGYFIAGGLVTSTGGVLLALGFVFAWMGYTFPDLMGEINGVPAPVSDVFIMVGFGLVIGGIIPLIVGMALIGAGVDKRKQSKVVAATAPAAKETTPPSPGYDQYHEMAGMERS